MSKAKKRMLLAAKILLLGLAFLFMFRCFMDPGYTKYGGVIAGLILPFVPDLVKKIYHAKIPYHIEMLYYFFVLIALDFGICLDLYKLVPFFDKAVHTLSGAGTALIGFYALRYFKAENTPKIFKGLFIVFFSISIAVAWEFFEFFCDKCLGQHMQQLVSTGVDDTMFDMLAATIGAVIGGFLMTNKKVQKFLEA